jgi:hypothetical protein
MMEEELDCWKPLWQEKNELFKVKLKANTYLNHLQGKKFFVCDGNHRFKA